MAIQIIDRGEVMEEVKAWEYERADAWRSAFPVVRFVAGRKMRMLYSAPACAGWAPADEQSTAACTVLCSRFATNAAEHGVYGGLLHGRPCLHIRPINAAIIPAATLPDPVRPLSEAERAGATAVCIMHEKRLAHIKGRPSPTLMPAPEDLRDFTCFRGGAWVQAINWQIVSALDFGWIEEMMALLVWVAYAGGRFFVYTKCLVGEEYMANMYRDLTKPWMLRDVSDHPVTVVGDTPGGMAQVTGGEEARAWLVSRMRREKPMRLVPGTMLRHIEMGPIRIGVQHYTTAYDVINGELRYYYGRGGARMLVEGKLATVRGLLSYEPGALGDYTGQPWTWLGHANRFGLWMPYMGIAPPDYDPDGTPGTTTDPDPDPQPPPPPPPLPPDPVPDPDPEPPEDPPADDGHGGYKFAGEHGLIVTPSITGYSVAVDHAWLRAQLDATKVSVTVRGARTYAYDRGDQQMEVTNTMYYGGGGAGGRTVTINPAWRAPVWGVTPTYEHSVTHALQPGRVNGVRLNRSGIPRKQTVRAGWGILARKDEDGCVWLRLDPDVVRGIALDLTHAVTSEGPVTCAIERGPWHVDINLTWQ